MRRREYTRWRSRSVTPWTPASSLASLRTSTARTSVLSPSWWHVSTVHQQPHSRSTLTSSSSHPKKLPLPALLRLLNVVKEDYNSWRVVLFGLVWICWDRNQIIEFLWNSEVCGVGVHLRNTRRSITGLRTHTQTHTWSSPHRCCRVMVLFFKVQIYLNDRDKAIAEWIFWVLVSKAKQLRIKPWIKKFRSQ